ncbi:MAG: hypothetical protein K0Q59_256 [Paenibacillus sp.]|nr:hypothetical protein [Paenibacillus sp.]
MQNRVVLRNLKRTNEEVIDLVIEDGIVADIAEAGSGAGDQLLDRSGLYVSSGWIDMHVHAFPEMDPYGDDVDSIGVNLGVTTVVDAGSCGADRIAELAASRERSKTNLLAFLNISRIGLARIDELSKLEWIDGARVNQAARDYPELIVGLKARMSKSVVGDSGIEPLHIARLLSDETELPIMVHIGSGPPAIEELMPLLRQGDIVTHYLNGKRNNLFDAEGEPLPVLLDAVRRGVHLDVGHGTASFSFRIAEAARRHGVPLHTISTDIYRGNRLNGPVYSMAQVLTKFLYLGYSLEQVIEAVTTRPADWLDKPELGRIRIGEPANLTLFAVRDEPTELIDSEGETRIAEQRIEAKGVFVHHEFLECQVWPEARH